MLLSTHNNLVAAVYRRLNSQKTIDGSFPYPITAAISYFV